MVPEQFEEHNLVIRVPYPFYATPYLFFNSNRLNLSLVLYALNDFKQSHHLYYVGTFEKEIL